MTLLEKIDNAISLLLEIKEEMQKRPGQPAATADDAGGSNPPGGGQPGKP